MFNILQYQPDLVNGSIDIKVVFQLKPTSEIKQDGGHFAKKASGDNWLAGIKKHYFTVQVENFLFHKKHIIESSPGHKSLSIKKQALDELFRYLNYACFNASLADACKWALTMQKQFETILPSITNNSYESSAKALNEIMNFARQHSNGSLIKKAS